MCSSASFLISTTVFFLEAIIHFFRSDLLKYNLLPGLFTGISCLLTLVYKVHFHWCYFLMKKLGVD